LLHPIKIKHRKYGVAKIATLKPKEFHAPSVAMVLDIKLGDKNGLAF